MVNLTLRLTLFSKNHYPILFRSYPWTLVVGAMLPVTIWILRMWENRWFWPESPAAAYGDPVLGIYLLLGARILHNHKLRRKRFYHTFGWYGGLAIFGLLAGISRLLVNQRFTRLEMIHDLVLVPIYLMLIAGILPAICVTRIHSGYKIAAWCLLVIYAITLLIDRQLDWIPKGLAMLFS